jgi:hypothetical protein
LMIDNADNRDMLASLMVRPSEFVFVI